MGADIIVLGLSSITSGTCLQACGGGVGEERRELEEGEQDVVRKERRVRGGQGRGESEASRPRVGERQTQRRRSMERTVSGMETVGADATDRGTDLGRGRGCRVGREDPQTPSLWQSPHPCPVTQMGALRPERDVTVLRADPGHSLLMWPSSSMCSPRSGTGGTASSMGSLSGSCTVL